MRPDVLRRWAGWAAVGTGVAIPLSVAASSALMALTVLLALFGGLYRAHWRRILSHPLVWLSIGLFGWLALSSSYSAVPLDEALRVLKKYRELLLLGLLMPLFFDPRTRRLGSWAFFAAMLLTLAVSYADAIGQLWEHGALVRDPEAFKHRITQNTLLAFAGFWLTTRFTHQASPRWPLVLLLGLLTFNVFFMVGGRTGQVIFLVLAGLALFLRFRWKGLLMAAAGSALLLLAISLVPGVSQQRMLETGNSLADYQAADYTTSTTLRLSFIPNSLELIAQRPLLGHGVGSFGKVYAEHVRDTPFPTTTNPHNEFLLLGVQAGLVGAGLFAAMLLLQLRLALRLPAAERHLALALVITMGMGCLLNSFLLDSTEGHWYAYFSALLYARLGEPRDTGGE